jgi:hypothetical protein
VALRAKAQVAQHPPQVVAPQRGIPQHRNGGAAGIAAIAEGQSFGPQAGLVEGRVLVVLSPY